MTRWASEDRKRIHDIEDELAWQCDGGQSPIARTIDAFHELLGSERAVAYQLGPRGDGLCVEWLHAKGLPPGIARLFDDWMRGKGVDVTGYNPIRPEPQQRNRVLDLAELRTIIGQNETPMTNEFWRRVGLRGTDQLRVLLCDGPSLLGWIGALQPERFNARQRRVLRRLAPALHRSLLMERAIQGHAGTAAALDAVVETIAAPVFIVRSGGRLSRTNTAGRALLERNKTSLREALSQAARGHSSPAARVTRIRARGTPDQFLLIMDALSPDLDTTARAAADRWGLTPRQREVLAWVLRGKSNVTIAAILGIGARTVELHVSALLSRVQVESRSGLVAAVMSCR